MRRWCAFPASYVGVFLRRAIAHASGLVLVQLPNIPQDTLLAFLRAFGALHSTLGHAFPVEDAYRLAAVLRSLVTYPYDDILLRDTENATPLQKLVMEQLLRMDPSLRLPANLTVRGDQAPTTADDGGADGAPASAAPSAGPGDAAGAATAVPALRAMVLTELSDYILLPFRPLSGTDAPAPSPAPARPATAGATYIALSLRSMDVALGVLGVSMHVADLYEDGVLERIFSVRATASARVCACVCACVCRHRGIPSMLGLRGGVTDTVAGAGPSDRALAPPCGIATTVPRPRTTARCCGRWPQKCLCAPHSRRFRP